MQDFEGLGAFYLGRPREGEGVVLYDSRDLVTHAVCVGMTGSGKTGLCIDLIEEAALDGIPTIAIDPKGDLGNLLLTFPELRGSDFAPWVAEEDAARSGQTVEAFAEAEAARWKEGLAGWGQDGARIGRLREAADFAIYTPGGDAGLPIALLGAFAPPGPLDDAETTRDAVSGTATGLLSLVGIEADPLRSREHILIATLLERAWQAGETLDLPGLIARIQSPGIDKVGVLELDAFYPAGDRFELATLLNNLLAAPGFEVWLRGEPLDVGRLLSTAEGKPRVSVLSIAHLGDAERMFFVTLLLNAVVGWMRRQDGTGNLRAILYLDEIAGYLPPVAQPPSKAPLLTLLKQARAFGLGVVLATQNPVDLDYKALSNAGTWMVGRLQTDRDRERLLAGLEGAAGSAPGFDRASVTSTLAGLEKRQFLLHNVHAEAPVVFGTRWTMSYLRGPLDRDDIQRLTGTATPAAAPAAGAAAVTAAPAGIAPAEPPAPAAAPPAAAAVAQAAPVLDPKIPHGWVPLRGAQPAGASLVYVPFVLGAASVRFHDAKAAVDVAEEEAYLAPLADAAVPVDWDAAAEAGFAPQDLEREPAAGARHAALPAVAGDAKRYARWERDLADWLYRTQRLALMRSDELDLVSRPGESEAEFRLRLSQDGRAQVDDALAKVRTRYEPKIAALEERIRKADQAVDRESDQARGAKLSAAISLGTTILGSLFSRKKVSASTVSKAGTTMRGAGRAMDQSGDVGRAKENVESLNEKLAELQDEFERARAEAGERLDPATIPLETASVAPRKTDIDVRLVSLAFAPHWDDGSGSLTEAWR